MRPNADSMLSNPDCHIVAVKWHVSMTISRGKFRAKLLGQVEYVQ